MTCTIFTLKIFSIANSIGSKMTYYDFVLALGSRVRVTRYFRGKTTRVTVCSRREDQIDIHCTRYLSKTKVINIEQWKDE